MRACRGPRERSQSTPGAAHFYARQERHSHPGEHRLVLSPAGEHHHPHPKDKGAAARVAVQRGAGRGGEDCFLKWQGRRDKAAREVDDAAGKVAREEGTWWWAE